jgi:hypothetical protein
MPFVGAQQMAGAFNQFVHQRTVLLTTYRRDGTPVGTPVISSLTVTAPLCALLIRLGN